jgi:hypothetical protein
VSREEAKREQGSVNGNLLLCRRSTKALMSSVSGLALVARWRGWVSEREWGGANEHHRSLREGASSLYSEQWARSRVVCLRHDWTAMAVLLDGVVV